LLKGPAIRDVGQQAVVSDGGWSKGSRNHPHDAVTGPQGANSRPHLENDPRTLTAEGWITWVHPQSVKDVAEVEARCAYGDTDLTVVKSSEGSGVLDEGEVVDAAFGGNVKTPGRGRRRRGQELR
jgi:hypothetical protein